MSRYYDSPVLLKEELPLREEFLSSMAGVQGEAKAELSVLRMGANGPDEEKPFAVVDILNIQSIALPQEERFQPVVTQVDDGQGFFFGRSHRMYSVTGFMIDSDLMQDQGTFGGVDRRLRGHLLAAWKKLYSETLRATMLVEKNRILRLKWGFSSVFGYMINSVCSIDATQPHLCSVNFSLFSVFETHAKVPRIVPDPATGVRSFPGLMSAEGLYRTTKLISPALSDQGQGKSRIETLVKGSGARQSVPPS